VPLGLLLKNIGFMLRTVPFAARLARREYEAGLELARQAGLPGFQAQSLLGLSLLDLLKGRGGDARARLDEAMDLAQPLEWPLLEEKIATAISDTGPDDR